MALRPWLELVRLPAVFTAPADVLAGAALAAAAGLAVPVGAVGLLVLASALIYCAGMAANDLCDAAVDARERPGRPIPSGRVQRGAVLGVVLALQAAGIGLAALVGVPAAGMAAGTVTATWLYNGLLKDTLVGPATMGLCRYGNALIGLTAAGALPPLGWVWAAPLTTLAYVTALTFISRHEVVGATRAAVQRPAYALVALAVAPAALAAVAPWPVAALAVAGPVLWLAGPLRRALAAPGPGPVRGLVMAGIFGIAMVDGVLALLAGGWWQAAVAVGLLVPGRLFGRWFYAT
ncbi:MAG: UbiA family prenyltransferase [Myxococcales bacterium]|nr:UbiA family prenyltransferase [Myxococcales bacterium]